jgi:uroporphyrinogen III methyltransferase/synthase
VVPERSVAEGLLEALLPRLAGRPAGRALVARAAEARDVLPHGLRRRGIETDVLALYRTVPEPLSEEQLAAVRAADYVTFTSSSTVRHLLRAAGDGGVGRARVVSIGPVTSATLREHGLEPDVEASRHDIDGVVEALLADAAQKRTSAS